MSIRCLRPIPILTYHQVDEPPPRGTPFRALTVAPAVFARHMRVLRGLGFRGLSMRDLQPYLQGERQGRVFGLTFDDGFMNVHQHALPVLRETGFTATSYVVAGHPEGTNYWDAAAGVASAPLTGPAQWREWLDAGQEIGSHTLDHVNLPKQDDDEARRQLVASRERLEAELAVPVTAFCYPYGAHVARDVGLAREAGYVTATTTVRGRVHAGADAWALPRVPVVRSTHFLGLLQKLLTTYEDRRGQA